MTQAQVIDFATRSARLLLCGSDEAACPDSDLFRAATHYIRAVAAWNGAPLGRPASETARLERRARRAEVIFDEAVPQTVAGLAMLMRAHLVYQCSRPWAARAILAGGPLTEKQIEDLDGDDDQLWRLIEHAERIAGLEAPRGGQDNGHGD